MALVNGLPFSINVEKSVEAAGYDGILFISAAKPGTEGPAAIQSAIAKAYQIDKAVASDGAVLAVDLPAGRVVYVPVSVNPDFDDVRSFGESGKKAIQRALKAGVKTPLVILSPYANFPYCQLVTLLGVFEALYVNLQYREDRPEVFPKVKQLGIYSTQPKKIDQIVKTAVALENGRYVARDVGGSDPERMAPPKVEEYIRAAFKNEPVSIRVISDLSVFEKEYPLFAAVNRAANEIERHRGRIIILTYEAEAPQETLFLVGKGVTYDTGGADIKAGGIMAGMSRDKCGAAAVGGFLKAVAQLKPTNVKVVGIMSMVRNSVGENCYVADEIIQSRAGLRVRIGNTDAEGRTILTDPLCYAKEEALKSVNPHLMTIATLTGHAYLTSGCGYSIVLDNEAARRTENALLLSKYSEQIGEPFEVSTIRREDYRFHKGKVEGEDVLQANNQPSSRTPRGHQGPAAFLIMASGLDKYGVGSASPIKYSHLDIAGAAGDVPENATGAPLLGLYAKFFNQNLAQLADN
ncbi:putative aminopeptidase W07G4.4 [Planococcus citri]|uniref:putative aminopeptidase W07G4.4 n=1 Tax=Planococcus citri TaxID=170843 RepID=UPI0031F76166